MFLCVFFCVGVYLCVFLSVSVCVSVCWRLSRLDSEITIRSYKPAKSPKSVIKPDHYSMVRNNASVPWVGLPGPVWGRFGS